jgi:hypothetical protein
MLDHRWNAIQIGFAELAERFGAAGRTVASPHLSGSISMRTRCQLGRFDSSQSGFVLAKRRSPHSGYVPAIVELESGGGGNRIRHQLSARSISPRTFARLPETREARSAITSCGARGGGCWCDRQDVLLARRAQRRNFLFLFQESWVREQLRENTGGAAAIAAAQNLVAAVARRVR